LQLHALEDTIVRPTSKPSRRSSGRFACRPGGIIVVDFIDMEEAATARGFVRAASALEEDKAPSKALSFNEFGLVCITPTTKQALRVLCQPCRFTGSACQSIPTLCYEKSRRSAKMVPRRSRGPNLTIRRESEIAKA